MRSSRLHDRLPKLLALAAAATLVAAGAGCASRSAARASIPPTTLLHSDAWVAPAVNGPPSAANFCSLLVSIYRHEAQIPQSATTKVKEQIVEDYVNTVPKVIAQAPADIAAPARLYLHSVAEILTQLYRAGLDYKKIPRGTLGPLLLDPAIKSAGNQVVAYSASQCHYQIGGA